MREFFKKLKASVELDPKQLDAQAKMFILKYVAADEDFNHRLMMLSFFMAQENHEEGDLLVWKPKDMDGKGIKLSFKAEVISEEEADKWIAKDKIINIAPGAKL